MVATAQPAITFRSPREQPYGILHNFARCPVEALGRTWPTSEHLYQAMKFAHDHPAVAAIHAAATPKEAKQVAYANSAGWEPGWDDRKLEAMRVVLRMKITSNPHIAQLLTATGAAELIETSAFDRYWGRVDGQGENWLGRLWMEVRDAVRDGLYGKELDTRDARPNGPRPAFPRPFVACRIESPQHGVRAYTQAQLDDAFADIARAKEKRNALLVAVVGSRDLDQLAPADAALPPHPHNAHATRDEKLHRYCLLRVAKAVQDLCSLHGCDLSRVVIVSGGARGIDRVARDYARAFDLPLIEFPARWQREDGSTDRSAGYARNAHIARVADEVIAWPRKNADGEYEGGTMDTTTRARLAEKPVTILP